MEFVSYVFFVPASTLNAAEKNSFNEPRLHGPEFKQSFFMYGNLKLDTSE
jgi:hypothetical protein